MGSGSVGQAGRPASDALPDDNHVVVHLLQLPLGHLHVVGGGVELVGLKALIAESDLEGLILGLVGNTQPASARTHLPLSTRRASSIAKHHQARARAGSRPRGRRTWGTELLSTWAVAALVVTARRAAKLGTTAARGAARAGTALVIRATRENMVLAVEEEG